MRAGQWGHPGIGVAVVAVMAGCSSSPTLEPEPGEIDWNVAVTRFAIKVGQSDTDVAYNPWLDELMDMGDSDAPNPDIDDLVASGLAVVCDLAEVTPSALGSSLNTGFMAREAVDGAVLAAASQDFREAQGARLFHILNHDAAGDWPPAEFTTAIERLSNDLFDEWTELYALQTSLEQAAFTGEGARAAQAAAAERCGVTVAGTEAPEELTGVTGLRLVAPPQDLTAAPDQ